MKATPTMVVLEGYPTTARVGRLRAELAPGEDVLYVVDTELAPYDTLSPLTRVSRSLTLLDRCDVAPGSELVLLQPEVASSPRDGLALACARAGLR